MSCPHYFTKAQAQFIADNVYGRSYLCTQCAEMFRDNGYPVKELVSCKHAKCENCKKTRYITAALDSGGRKKRTKLRIISQDLLEVKLCKTT